jgi:hypothetical protein
VVVARNRDQLADAFAEIGWGPFLLSGCLAVLGTASLFGLWRALLRGLGAEIPVSRGWDVFFVSQLGKYLPGLVWPAVAQMEAGRRWGLSRRVMLAANLLMLTVLTGSGLVVGLLLLPWSTGVDGVPWWAWLGAALAVGVCLYPRMLTALVDRVFRRRASESPRVSLTPSAMARALAWALLVWVVYGVHVWVLVRAVGGSGADAAVASVGGMAIGWALGLVVVIAPAGAGVRDGILVAVLAPLIGRTPALAVALGSRGLQALADVLLAAAGALRTARASDPAQQ